MHISFGIRWHYGKTAQEEMEKELFTLLVAIEQSGSLRQAAENIHISYRHAWGLLKKWQQRFHQPLVKMKRGRHSGAHLTELGLTLLEEERTLLSELGPQLEARSKELNDSLQNQLTQNPPDKLRFHASHDLVVGQLVEELEKHQAGQVHYQTQGSLENLKSLSQHQCDIAGFHFPINKRSNSIESSYRHWLENRNLSFIELVTRAQGLMINKQNPKKIGELSDLSKRSVRFINRQSGSGTRSLFDALLKEQGLPAKSINGYQHEEFTHVAVAALIASGAADAGMGIHAAARQFGLKFIPLVHERYVLAFSEDIKQESKKILIEKIKSRSFKNKIKSLPGYDISRLGQRLTIENLFD